MKILIVGANGTIGKAVVDELKPRHEIITASTSSGDIKLDITDINSIKNMYEKVKNIDAIILTAGKVHFGEINEMTEKEYAIGLNNKLMGQVNVVLLGLNYLNDSGSFTLTSGIINRDPVKFGSSAAMVNGAIDGFVRNASIEMPRNIRINCVSPTILTESLENLAPYFRGFQSVPAKKVALAYSKSAEGLQNGQIYCVN